LEKNIISKEDKIKRINEKYYEYLIFLKKVHGISAIYLFYFSARRSEFILILKKQMGLPVKEKFEVTEGYQKWQIEEKTQTI